MQTHLKNFTLLSTLFPVAMMTGCPPSQDTMTQDTDSSSDTLDSSSTQKPETTEQEPTTTQTIPDSTSTSDSTAQDTTSGAGSDGSTGEVQSCGDGLVQPGEECDDKDSDVACYKCQFAYLLFASIDLYTGNLEGQDGADQACDEAAGEAGLEDISFMAWLAGKSPLTAPVYRFGKIDKPIVMRAITEEGEWEYLLVSETGIAGLMTELAHQPNYNEYGHPVDEPHQAWTGSNNNGELFNEAYTCEGWTTPEGKFEGLYGDTQRVDFGWSAAHSGKCGEFRRLYCLQSNLTPGERLYYKLLNHLAQTGI